jgi:hypothetical protein
MTENITTTIVIEADPEIVVEILPAQGPQGAQGEVGPAGPAGNSITYTHTQSVPSTTWTINHNLNKKPSVTIVDSAETVVRGSVVYTDTNTLVLSFSAGFAGKAYLN